MTTTTTPPAATAVPAYVRPTDCTWMRPDGRHCTLPYDHKQRCTFPPTVPTHCSCPPNVQCPAVRAPYDETAPAYCEHCGLDMDTTTDATEA